MRRIVLMTLACGLGLIGLGALGGYYFTRPTLLKIAVARDTEDFRLVTAMAHVLVAARENVRLRIAPVDNAAAAANALEGGDVDLAVIRSDINAPPSGQTLAILHRNAVLLLAPSDRSVKDISDFRGKRIGVLRGVQAGVGNMQALDAILNQYDIAPAVIKKLDLTRAELFEAIKGERVDAVLMVGALTSEGVNDVVTTVAQAGGGVVFIPITEAKAIAQRAPAFESLEVVRGLFGGAPPRPAAAFETLGVSVRLMARSTLKGSIAGDLTRILFSERLRIARLAPLANQISAPATNKDAFSPVHAGAAAYLDGEESGVFDKYSDFIYIGAMLLSVIGSLLAALASRLSVTRHSVFDVLLERLLAVLKRARAAASIEELDCLAQEADDILVAGMANRSIKGADSHAMTALGLALEQARLAIRERRMSLSGPQNAASGPLEARFESLSPALRESPKIVMGE